MAFNLLKGGCRSLTNRPFEAGWHGLPKRVSRLLQGSDRYPSWGTLSVPQLERRIRAYTGLLDVISREIEYVETNSEHADSHPLRLTLTALQDRIWVRLLAARHALLN